MNSEDHQNISKDTEEISLKDVIFKLRRWWLFLCSKWVTILVVGITGGFLGLTYAILKKPIYKAELSFALEDDKSGGSLGNALGVASQFGIDLNGSSSGAFSGDNLLELMKSRSMVEKTLLTSISIDGKNQTLADLYITFNSLYNNWKNTPGLSNIKFPANVDPAKFTLKQDSILSIFYKSIIKNNLSVDKIDKKLSIVTVTVISKNEMFSKYFAEILTKTVSDFYIDTKTKKSVQNVAILQRQTDSVRKELNAALSGVASSLDVNPNPNPALQILRVPAQRRSVDVQVNQAILSQLVANLEISKVSLRKETPLIQIIDKPILPLEKTIVSKMMGVIAGGFISVFLIIILLSIRKIVDSKSN